MYSKLAESMPVRVIGAAGLHHIQVVLWAFYVLAIGVT